MFNQSKCGIVLQTIAGILVASSLVTCCIKHQPLSPWLTLIVVLNVVMCHICALYDWFNRDELVSSRTDKTYRCPSCGSYDNTIDMDTKTCVCDDCLFKDKCKNFVFYNEL